MTQEPIDFEMYTQAGNRKATTVLGRLKAAIAGSRFYSKEEFNRLYEKSTGTIRSRFAEFDDTEPRYRMRARVNRALEERGYSYRIHY